MPLVLHPVRFGQVKISNRMDNIGCARPRLPRRFCDPYRFSSTPQCGCFPQMQMQMQFDIVALPLAFAFKGVPVFS